MNYPVTTPFGQVAGYPLNNGFHNGIDYGYPMGTPVVVNGVTIGLSNNTGTTTGPHLHVGKFINGQVQDPGVGNGFTFDSAVVFDTGFDNTDGNYVRITGDGALWNYLHLESILVTKGQILKGEEMLDASHQATLFVAYLGRLPSPAEISRDVGNISTETMINNLDSSSEYADKKKRDQEAYDALSGFTPVTVQLYEKK